MRRMPPMRRLLTFAILLVACAAATAAPRLATITALDGDAAVLRDDAKLAAAEGVALQAGDILVTGAQARLVRIEYPSGLAVAFGPDTLALIDPHLGDEPVYLLAGWAKLNAPKSAAGALAAPGLRLSTAAGGAMVDWQRAGAPAAFAESGALELKSRPAGALALALAAGQMVALGAPGAKPEVSSRPTPAFVQAMPRAFMDSLPSRLAAFQGKDVAPKPLGPLAWADAQPWIDAEPALRKLFVKRWHALAKVPEFRRGLVAGLKDHPEWEPVLYPPAPKLAPPSDAAAH